MTKNNEFHDPRQIELQMPRVTNHLQEDGSLAFRSADTNRFMSAEQVSDAFNDAQESYEQAKDTLDVFDRSAELAADPRFNDMGIPELKVAGVGRRWLKAHGYDGVKLDDFKADVLEYKELKAGEEARAAKQAERVERNTKLEAAYQDRQAEAKEFREGRQAGEEAVDKKAYLAMLNNGGRIALQRNPKLVADIKATAIDQAKSEGHDVSKLEKPVKIIPTNPAAEARASEMGQLLKDFNRGVISTPDKSPSRTRPERPTDAGAKLRSTLEAGEQAEAKIARGLAIQKLIGIKQAMAERYLNSSREPGGHNPFLDDIYDNRIISILKEVYGTLDADDPRVVKAARELDDYEGRLIDKGLEKPINPWLIRETDAVSRESSSEKKRVDGNESDVIPQGQFDGDIPTKPRKSLRVRMSGAIVRARNWLSIDAQSSANNFLSKRNKSGDLVTDEQGKNVIDRRKVGAGVVVLGIAVVAAAGAFVHFSDNPSHNERVATTISTPYIEPTTTVASNKNASPSTTPPSSPSDNSNSVDANHKSGTAPISNNGEKVTSTPESLSGSDTIWAHVEKRLSSQGSQPTQAQILAETQRILTLNNLTPEQARNLPEGFTFST